MKSLPLIAVLVLLAAPLRADLRLRPHDLVAICGDSITEQRQYSVFMEDYFLMCQPEPGLRAAQFGWGGETAAGFLARIDDDVLPFKPSVVTTSYGMNDGGYAPMSRATGEAYRQALTACVEKLKAAGVRQIVLGSPGCVDPTVYANRNLKYGAAEYNQTLAALMEVGREVAQAEGVGFADVYTPMAQVMAKSKAAYGSQYPFIAGGGVHPGNNGHLVMAYAFLKGLGCDGAIGTITVDFKAEQAGGTPGRRILSCSGGVVRIESTKYPFCFQGAPDKPEQSTASVVNFFPFNERLNRYLLVVKHLPGSRAKIVWGTVTKEYAASDLAKGINLAAEFLVNPFCDQFLKVNAAVQAQQAQETILVKNFVHGLAAFKTMAPHSAERLDQVARDGMERESDLFAAAAAQVIPIQHEIKIIPDP